MKKITLLFLSAVIFFLQGSSQGFLRVHDKRIENDVNKDFVLRGMGFGGWMLQEGYMFDLGFLGQQYKIREKIASLTGDKATTEFYSKWLQYHTQKADIDSMASWGFNAIRLPLHYNLFTLSVKDEPVKGRNTWIPKGFEMVDSLLSWCRQDHIYLILDLHAAPGGEGNDLPISDRHPDEPSLWQSKENRDKTVALWKELARRYANEQWIGGYDILNETNWGFDDSTDTRGTAEKHNVPLRNLMIDITKAIRSQDKKHIIFLEGNGFANNYNGIFPLWDKNMVISFHKYGNYTTSQTIQTFLNYREKYNVPLWLGETGENSNTWFTNNIRLMEDNDIGWSWWQLKKMGINNPLEIVKPANYQAFVAYCAGKGDKPDAATAQRIMNDLLKNIRIENNIYHKDVIDAMFRQAHSTATIPFKEHLLANDMYIPAVEYDLGRNGYAYNDNDTASYMYTPGVHTQGNRGHAFRNDGVDIKYDGKGEPYVFSIEKGEWLLYTLNVTNAGNYHISFTAAGNGKIIVYNNDKKATDEITLESNSGDGFTESPAATISLQKGTSKLKIYFSEGGFNLKGMNIKKQ